MSATVFKIIIILLSSTLILMTSLTLATIAIHHTLSVPAFSFFFGNIF